MKILIAIIVFSLIIIIHELGHFILAKMNGVYVTEFSVGMGPRIVSTVKGETRYSLKLFPFGGSCMMLGEDEDVKDDDRAFGKKSVWARISIIAAGPIFNFILAFVISIFVVSAVGYDKAYITKVDTNSPAMQAGLEQGDVITKLGGRTIDFGRDYEMYLQFRGISSKPIEVEYKRDGKKHTTSIVPELRDLYMLGFSYNPDVNAAVIQTLSEGFPLYNAGLKVGDTITSINGVEIESGSDLSNYMNTYTLTDQPVNLRYERDGKSNEVTVTPQFVSSGYSLGFSVNGYYEKTDALGIIKYSFKEVKYYIRTTFLGLEQIFKGKVTKDDVAGPVRLVNVIGTTYETAKDYGILQIFVSIGALVTYISANLGVMNLLPLPALDGGRLVFMFIEIIRGGKPIAKEKEGLVHMIGLFALMALMVFVMFNDITSLLK